MQVSKSFVLVRSCGSVGLDVAYDFLISRFPIAMAASGAAIVLAEPAHADLYRASWHQAASFCNLLSRAANLAPAYQLDADGRAGLLVSLQSLTQSSFRLPTPREWYYAAHGWSGARTGDYFPIQRQHFRIPALDFPISDAERDLFEQGYSQAADLLANPIGIHGMLAYAREWCCPLEDDETPVHAFMRWEEYYTNYDNDIGYQPVMKHATDGERLPFRVVLPCSPGPED